MSKKIIQTTLTPLAGYSPPVSPYQYTNRALPIILGVTALGIANYELFNPTTGIMNTWPTIKTWAAYPLANASTGAAIFLMANNIKIWTEGAINTGTIRLKERFHEAEKGMIFGLSAAYLPKLFSFGADALLSPSATPLFHSFVTACLYLGTIPLLMVFYNAFDSWKIKHNNIDGQGGRPFRDIMRSKNTKTLVYYTSWPSKIYGDSWPKRIKGALLIGSIPRGLIIYTFFPPSMFATLGTAASMVFAWFHSSNRFK